MVVGPKVKVLIIQSSILQPLISLALVDAFLMLNVISEVIWIEFRRVLPRWGGLKTRLRLKKGPF